jgi:hypothetical protein
MSLIILPIALTEIVLPDAMPKRNICSSLNDSNKEMVAFLTVVYSFKILIRVLLEAYTSSVKVFSSKPGKRVLSFLAIIKAL